jgi:hypothetical protein
MTGSLACANLTRLLNCSAEQQQFLGDGRFAGIRMADNGKGSSAVDFLFIMLHGDAPKKAGQNKGEEDIFAQLSCYNYIL